MASLSFDDIVIMPKGETPRQLKKVDFAINFMPQTERPKLDLSMNLKIERNYIYYDEMQNVWYMRFDGLVTTDALPKMFSRQEYSGSIFFPLESI